MQKTWLQDIILLTLLIGTLFTLFLGTRPLSTPDEARYSEIPREMVVTGDYVTPHINYIKYFEKPPFFYWMQASAIKLFGLSEWSMRSTTALMGLLGCLFTYIAARKLFTRRCGWLASLILATSLLYYLMARFITIDMTLTTLLTASLFSFLLGVHEPTGKKRNLCMWSMYAFSALAMLTKGLVGVIFPGMIIFVWMAIFNDWKNLKTYCLPTGILIWLAIALPWHILVQLRNPEFFHYYFIKQQFARYLTPIENREQPFWFLSTTLIVGFVPWIVFLIPTVRYNLPSSWQQRSQQKPAIFLLLWVALIFIFFQFSNSLLIPYILPVFPALAVLTARYLDSLWETKYKPSIYVGLWIFLTITIALLIVTIANVVYLHLLPNSKFLLLISSLLLCTAITALGFYKRYNIKTAIIALIVGFSTTLTLINLGTAPFTTTSIKPLAIQLKAILKPNNSVLIYHGYAQDLPFYLQRRVVLVAPGNSELSFGMQHQNMSGWLISDETLWQDWRNSKRLFMLMDRYNYMQLLKNSPAPIYVIAQNSKSVIVTNQRVN